VLGSEAPEHGHSGCVSFLFPRGRDFRDGFSARQALLEALPGENGELELTHMALHGGAMQRRIQPASMFGCIVPLDLACDPPRLLGSKRLVERGWAVRIQVVHDQADPVCLGEAHIDEPPQLVGEVDRGSPLRCMHVAPPLVRGKEQEQVARAFALVLVVLSAGLSRRGRQRTRTRGRASGRASHPGKRVGAWGRARPRRDPVRLPCARRSPRRRPESAIAPSATA
jgi:hypothetical protein